ncbi:hypothetical protein ACLUEY_13995 [Vreelandella aquamarina]
MKKNTGIIIVGVNRGGTSAIAASLNSLDIFLGELWYEPTYEDVHLARYFRNKNWRKFKNQVKKYESEHNLFAWKLPDSINRLNKVKKTFKNPKYIFVFRDIYAVSHRQKHSLEIPLFKGMLSSLFKYLKALLFIRMNNPDHLLVSYEKVLTDKDKFAFDLLSFLELEVCEKNIELIKEALSSSGYREWAEKSKYARLLKKSGYNGYLDYLDEKKVTGWVKSFNDDQPVMLEVFINEEKVGEVIADQYRGDLVDLAISETGRNGFTFFFKASLNPHTQVSIKPKDIKMHLIGSPRQLGSPTPKV